MIHFYDFFVNPEGENHPLAGKDVTRPFKTINYALSQAQNSINWSPMLKLADGIYDEAITTIDGAIIEGNVANPNNVVVLSSNKSNQVLLTKGYLNLKGVKIKATHNQNNAIEVNCFPSYLNLSHSIIECCDIRKNSHLNIVLGGTVYVKDTIFKGYAKEVFKVQYGSYCHISTGNIFRAPTLVLKPIIRANNCSRVFITNKGIKVLGPTNLREHFEVDSTSEFNGPKEILKWE